MKQSKLFSVIVSIACAGFIFSACKENKNIVPRAEYATYVSAYTGGLIPTNAVIRIELAGQQIIPDAEAEVKEKLFVFSPSLSGKTFWVDNQTIEFIPDADALKPGELYNASFALHKVMPVKDNTLKDFRFSFRVEERNFALHILSVNVVAGEKDKASVEGEIQFSDTPALDDVSKTLAAKRNGESFIPVIEPTNDPHRFRFAFNGISRLEKDSQLDIKLSGKTLDIPKTAEEKVVIPAVKPFKLLLSEIIETPGYGIRLTFSDPLSDTQDLTGLITLNDNETSFVSQIQDNNISLFFEREPNATTLRVQIDQSLRDADNHTLNQSTSVALENQSFYPQVKFLSSGSIMPNSNSLILPFRAVSLYAVDLKIVRIYESNVLMFLQDNLLKTENVNELNRAGRLIYKKTLRLDSDLSKNVRRWENYSINLAELIKQEPGAVYRVQLSFKQHYSAYPCDNGQSGMPVQTNSMTKVGTDELTEEEEAPWNSPSYYYDYNYDWDSYKWSERENPCHATYYMLDKQKAVKNVLATNLGVIVKANSANNLWVAVSDILTTKPIPNADVKAYNFQMQPIGSSKTDDEGFAVIETKKKPFFVVASKGKQKNYLRIADGEENQLNRFDVGGENIQKGLKGFLYGERGVWRPGDTLHIAFMMDNSKSNIPSSHPVTLEIYNPRGQFYAKQISTNGVNGLYTFAVPTNADDPTGLWTADVKIGGVSFYKSLRIETIKPNRLKINLDIPDEKLAASKRAVPVKIHASWLTGATAHHLHTNVEMIVNKSPTAFKNYDDYLFENPASTFSWNVMQLFEGTLDEKGDAEFDLKLPEMKDAPGMLRATLLCNVLEQGGDVSLLYKSVPFSPFDAYVGIRFNLNLNTYYLETDKDNIFDVVTLNSDGKPVNRANLEYKIYNVDWSWWWEHNDNSYASYLNNTSVKPVAEGRLATTNGKGTIRFKVDYPGWGRYLVYVKDRDGGHATGGIIYVDWPDWRGRSQKSDPNGITMLTFSTNKTSYEVGEEVVVTIPGVSGGRALVSIENGSSVISREWLAMSTSGDTKYTFKITNDMTPNVYLHISLLQPHEQTVNDLPIRMYGVIPVFVTNKNTVLEPRIAMDDVLRPETAFTVKIKETQGKPMTYTLAIVDDGLLSLTNFRTPDPWNAFYAREALGIRTWDMYDLVMGAFGGKYASLFSVGGGFDGSSPNAKSNYRFKPVVKFIGPFSLKNNEEKTHKLELPPYVGSVRVMVVAGQDGAYGHAEKTVPVRMPLMILPSLPRVTSINEEIALPVNVFAMENTVKNATIKVETIGLIQLIGTAVKQVHFDAPGDQMVYFNLKTGSVTGVEKITVTATSNGLTSKETIEIDVRNPHTSVIRSQSQLLEAGKTTELAYQLNRPAAGEWVSMEISRIPPIKISQHLDYLINYNHYCSEQLTSCALPLLFLEDFKTLAQTESDMVRKNVLAAISNLYGRQLTNGGIVYWPRDIAENEWITSYAGSFLILAKEKGYDVNASVLTRWKNHQRQKAQSFRITDDVNSHSHYLQRDLNQAYRLYTLALAGSPEIGAMNRLKESRQLSLQAKWRLAAAYALAGKTDAANDLIFNLPAEVEPYVPDNASFGSSYRDEAMILETLILAGRNKEAFEVAQNVARNLSSSSYYSTQTVAYGLVAMGRFAQKTSGILHFNWTVNGVKQPAVTSDKVIFRKDIPAQSASGKVTVENAGNGLLHVNIISKTTPLVDSLPSVNNKIHLDVSYLDAKGSPVDIRRLKQGADFYAVAKVSNFSVQSYTNLALTHIVPSGWEIYNEQMIHPDEGASSPEDYLYRDIRDDRVLTYFHLPYGKTKVFKIRLMASYAGSFTLPAIQCEAMYDPSVHARTQAGQVVVER